MHHSLKPMQQKSGTHVTSQTDKWTSEMIQWVIQIEYANQSMAL